MISDNPLTEEELKEFEQSLDQVGCHHVVMGVEFCKRFLHQLREANRLRKAIEDHRSQKADDRCQFDDDKLYEALGDGIKCDRRVGSKEEMLKNCQRFIDNRCESGGWKSYTELEAENEKLKKKVDFLVNLAEKGPPDGL